jgi:hypothetical protein
MQPMFTDVIGYVNSFWETDEEKREKLIKSLVSFCSQEKALVTNFSIRFFWTPRHFFFFAFSGAGKKSFVKKIKHPFENIIMHWLLETNFGGKEIKYETRRRKKRSERRGD